MIMQTRSPLLRRARTIFRYAAICVAAIAVMTATTACSSPRIAGRAESEYQETDCERSYRSATDNDSRAQHGPIIVRYLASSQSAQDWQTVAAACPQRITEGVIRSAQAQWLANNLAQSISQTYTASAHDGNALRRQRLDGLTALPLSKAILRKLALAEDSAGSALQVLAAKGVAGATLTASDNHHAAGSQLMSIAGNTGDLRQKEYDITNLLANPSTATDQSPGLQASTVSIIEIDCALEELAALASPDNTVSNTGATAASTRTNQMLVLVRLITGHCYEAFAQGYPSTDFAVFASSSKQ